MRSSAAFRSKRANLTPTVNSRPQTVRAKGWADSWRGHQPGGMPAPTTGRWPPPASSGHRLLEGLKPASGEPVLPAESELCSGPCDVTAARPSVPPQVVANHRAPAVGAPGSGDQLEVRTRGLPPGGARPDRG